MEFCGPCRYRDKSTSAIKYCLTCQESQCKTCADNHSSSKATRNHLLLNVNDFNSDSKTTRDLDQFQICSYHSEKKLEFFCIDHEHLMCSTCLIKRNPQRLDCKTVVDIDSAGEQVIKSKFDEQIQKDLENIKDNCNEGERQIQSFIDNSHKVRQDIQQYIDNMIQKITTDFDACKGQILKEVDRNLKAQSADLGRRQMLLRRTHRATDENKNTLHKIASNNSRSDLFRCIFSIIGQLKESKAIDEATDPTMHYHTYSVQVSPAFLVSMDTLPVIQCTTETNSTTYCNKVDLISNMDRLFEATKQVACNRDNVLPNYLILSSDDAEKEVNNTNSFDASRKRSEDSSSLDVKSTQPKTSACKLKSNIQVLHNSEIALRTPDGKEASIVDIITLHDGSLVISDFKWSRLIRVNEDLTFREIAELSKPPGHMTALNERYLAVCLPTASRIAFISLLPEFKWMRNFITEYTPKGLYALDTKRLLVSMVNDEEWFIDIRTIEGVALQHVGKARSILDAEHISSLNLMPSSPRYFLQCCKKSYALYCFDTKSKEIFKHRIMSPNGIHVDSNNVIYVIESFGMLHILSRSGDLLQKVPIPKKANGITCNKANDRLVITRQKSNVLCVFTVKRI